MPAFGLISWRVIGVALLLSMLAGGSATLAWRFQQGRYERQLAEQAKAHAEMLNQLTLTAAALQRAEQDKRLMLEQRLSASEQTHYRVLRDAQQDQNRMRDRLATADVRLSVLLAADDVAPGCAVPATTDTGRLDHGAVRARLDPAHAQRIIAITDTGDRALIALQACQAYISALGR